MTRGGWDLRPTAERMPWPELAGKRCLDVGPMDGFWAFELERRGAAEVLAVDVLDASRLDTRVFERPRRRQSERNFALAAELLGSRAQLRDLSVYDLDPADVGRFDVIVMGYVLETTAVIRDRPGPAIGPRELAIRPRLLHRVGIRGRSAALRARPTTL